MLVGEMAAQSMTAVRVFEQFGIDYCCGGKRTLEDVCRAQGLNPVEVITAIDESSSESVGAQDWNTAPLDVLVAHIVEKHHGFLRIELPRIAGRIARVVQSHSARDPRLAEVQQVFGGLQEELLQHLEKEEMVLFPVLTRTHRRGIQVPAYVSAPITVMEMEHDSAGRALAQLRLLTDDYLVPPQGCNTYRAMIEGMKELEADLHVHIHLENNVLFPRALKSAGVI